MKIANNQLIEDANERRAAYDQALAGEALTILGNTRDANYSRSWASKHGVKVKTQTINRAEDLVQISFN